jgi:hypothetical protein
MNLLGSPIALIFSILEWGAIGLIINILLFLISVKIWKFYSKNNNATLSIDPAFKFGAKTWRFKK